MKAQSQIIERRMQSYEMLTERTNELVQMLTGEKDYTTEDVKRVNGHIDDLRKDIRLLDWVLVDGIKTNNS